MSFLRFLWKVHFVIFSPQPIGGLLLSVVPSVRLLTFDSACKFSKNSSPFQYVHSERTYIVHVQSAALSLIYQKRWKFLWYFVQRKQRKVERTDRRKLCAPWLGALQMCCLCLPISLAVISFDNDKLIQLDNYMSHIIN